MPSKNRDKQTSCLNCNKAFSEAVNFCPDCGQENHEFRQPLRSILGDVFENLLNIDSRFLKTLSTLIIAPGKITKEYNAGLRKSYAPPIRFYLFASLIYFLLYPIASGSLQNDPDEKLIDSFEEILTDTDSITLNLGMQSIRLKTGELLEISEFSDVQVDSFFVARGLEPTFFAKKLFHQSARLFNSNGRSLNQQMMRNISIGMFFLMPVFAGLIALFYRRQNRFFVEHLIYSIHLHTLAFLWMTFLLLFLYFDFLSYEFLTFIGILPYLIVSQMKVYEASFKQVLLKSIGILITYGLFVGIALTAISILSVMFYS